MFFILFFFANVLCVKHYNFSRCVNGDACNSIAFPIDFECQEKIELKCKYNSKYYVDNLKFEHGYAYYGLWTSDRSAENYCRKVFSGYNNQKILIQLCINEMNPSPFIIINDFLNGYFDKEVVV